MMRSIRCLASVLLLLTLLAPGLSVLAQSTAHAVPPPPPTLQLPTNAMLAGSAQSVMVLGSHFTALSAVSLRLDNTVVVGSAQTDPAGAFTAIAAIPATAVGQHTINATDAANLSANQPLYIVSLTLSPSRAPNGMQVTIDGTGFQASQLITGQLGGITVVSRNTDGLGALHDTFLVPATLNGQQPLVLQQGTDPAMVLRDTFTVTHATLTLSPPVAGSGYVISATGQGFAPDWDHMLRLDSQPLRAVHTTSDGTFGPIQFTVPSGIITGQHTMSVSTNAGHVVASAALTIHGTPAVLALTPSSGVAGRSIQATGSGFQPGEAVAIIAGTTVMAVPTANVYGQISAVVALPQTLPAGILMLQAVGQISHLVASAAYTIPVPNLSLSQLSVAAGATVTVTGRNFAAHEDVILAVGSTALATARADGSGTFVMNANVPAAQPAGTAEITATGQSSRQVARASLSITALARISLSATTVPEGGTITVAGAGFGPGEPVVLSISGATLHTVVATVQGEFSTGVTIPATAPVSQVTLTATGQQTHRAASSNITVTLLQAHLTLSVTSVVASGSLQVSGSAFRPSEPVQITIPGHVLATATANAQGAFTAVTVTLPASVGPGAHTISANGMHSQKTAGAGVTVIARSASLSASPSAFASGTPVRIEGSNFLPGERVTLSISGNSFAVALAGGNGSFVLTVSLPAHLNPGSHQIMASGMTSSSVALVSVRITAPAAQSVGSASWYFAAGRTDNGFSEQIDVLNTNASPVHGTITFFYGVDQTKVYPFTLQAQARGTYDAAAILGVRTRFATAVTADLPIVAARSSQRGTDAMTGSTGVSTPSRTWYMAEGYTGLTFQEELDLLNPGNQTARVHIVWPLFNGKTPVIHDVVLAPRSHLTIPVNSFVDRASHATVLSADQSIVASRTMLFGTGQQGAHAREGAMQASTTLYFAEGSTTNGFEEYLTILNPQSGQAARITTSFFDRQGALLATREIVVDPLHRGNIKVNDVVQSNAISAVLQSSIPIVAERTMYFGAPNGAADGTVVFGRATPALGWAFAGGDTRPGRSEFELLFNPNRDSSVIVATFYGENGRPLQRTFTLPGHSRMNIDVTLSVPELARSLHGVVLHSSNGVSFVAEQALYANNMHNGSATVGVPIG
jgi:hypothetical protein